MAKTCSACKHLERPAIDSAIVGDEPIADIAKRFGLDRFVITRHRKHVIELVAKSPKVEVIAQADTIITQIFDLETLMSRKSRNFEAAGFAAAVPTGFALVSELSKCGSCYFEFRISRSSTSE
jgi:hypothetical protein